MQVKRVLVDVLLLITIMLIFSSKVYESFPAPLQLISMKALLVSAGFLHAHITRKLAFPTVNWDLEKFNPKNVVVIVLYVMFIYAYSQGG